MNKKLSNLLFKRSLDNNCESKCFRLAEQQNRDEFLLLLETMTSLVVTDEMHSQLVELLKSRNPGKKYSAQEMEAAIASHLGDTSIEDYGVWVYYSWSNRVVHILDEQEFIEVRTTRNQQKITREERDVLATKKIGVIGLSVGQSVALTLAMERSFGELRIADFDVIELSNLNRIRTGLTSLGVPKTFVVAREIAELDPFLNVTLYNEGINEENCHAFFTEGGKLDLLVEECDGLDVKIRARTKARELGIPVVMDTSDRGMLDVERFDLEPQRPILHGLIDHIDYESVDLASLTTDEKVPFILPMLGAEVISTRLKASMLEIDQTLSTWPQLATSVILGGALAGDVTRRILLDQFQDSGRYYVDLEALVSNKDQNPETVQAITPTPDTLSNDELIRSIDASSYLAPAAAHSLTEDQLATFVQAGVTAPSGGNCQPWKMVYKNKVMYVFHDQEKSFSLLDYNHMGSYLSVGSLVENVVLKAHEFSLEVTVQHFDTTNESRLVAALSFLEKDDAQEFQTASHDFDHLVSQIEKRVTNRAFNERGKLPPQTLDSLRSIASATKGANVQFVTSDEDLAKLSKVIAGVDRLRLLHERGHSDFMKESRWTLDENLATRNGVDLATIDLTPSDLAGMKMAGDWKPVELLAKWRGGTAFEKMAHRWIDGASALGFLTMPDYSQQSFFEGGRVLQRIWLEATRQGIAFQPVSPATFFFARLLHGKGIELPEWMQDDFSELRELFTQSFTTHPTHGEIFLFRLCVADEPAVKSLRKPIENLLIKL